MDEQGERESEETQASWLQFARDPLIRNLVVRFPDERDPAERVFAEAARQRREGALARLLELLPGLDVAGLADDADAATLIVTPASPPGVRALRVDDALDLVARSQDPGAGLVNMPVEGHGQQNLPVDAVSGVAGVDVRLVAGRVARFVEQGQTLIVNGLDRFWEPLRSLTADLLTAFAAVGSGANVYVSYGAAEGFGAHWDDHDVVIIQTRGRKYWEVYAPTALSPMRPNTPDPIGGDLVWSGDVEPGQALFIPRGWGHRVEAYDELSVHVTLSIHRFTVATLIGHLFADATNWPLLRANVPFDPTRPPTSYAGSVFDEPGGLRSHIDPLLDGLSERALAASRASVPPTLRQSFSDSLEVTTTGQWGDAVVEAPYPAGIMIADGDDGGNVTLAMGGSIVPIDRGMAALVAAAASGPVAVSDLAQHAPFLDEKTLHQVVAGLVEVGVFQITGRKH